IQLLQMDIVPTLVEWGKQGEVGRRKTNQVTRYLALVVAFIQSIGITLGFNALTQMGLVKNQTPQTYIEIAIIMTAGTMLLTWLGDEITDKGLGNGISVIILLVLLQDYQVVYGKFIRKKLLIIVLVIVGKAFC